MLILRPTWSLVPGLAAGWGEGRTLWWCPGRIQWGGCSELDSPGNSAVVCPGIWPRHLGGQWPWCPVTSLLEFPLPPGQHWKLTGVSPTATMSHITKRQKLLRFSIQTHTQAYQSLMSFNWVGTEVLPNNGFQAVLTILAVKRAGISDSLDRVMTLGIFVSTGTTPQSNSLGVMCTTGPSPIQEMCTPYTKKNPMKDNITDMSYLQTLLTEIERALTSGGSGLPKMEK